MDIIVQYMFLMGCYLIFSIFLVVIQLFKVSYTPKVVDDLRFKFGIKMFICTDSVPFALLKVVLLRCWCVLLDFCTNTLWLCCFYVSVIKEVIYFF